MRKFATTMKRNKGQMTMGVGVLWAIITTTLGVAGSYYTSASTINEKINESAAVINSEISTDRERIATLEEAIKTIKDSQQETRSDVKEILRRVK